MDNDAEVGDDSGVVAQLLSISATVNPQLEDKDQYSAFPKGVEYMIIPPGTSSLVEESLSLSSSTLHDYFFKILKSEFYTAFTEFKT